MKTYQVEIILLSEMLGTNPMDPNVMDNHILDRQRKLIAEKSPINSKINKYLNAKQISEEKGKKELESLKITVEDTLGRDLSQEEYDALVEGDLKTIKGLKETFIELDVKGTTCFFRNPDTDEEKVCIGSHMIHGFLKAAAKAIGRTMPRKNGTMLNSVSYTQSIINEHCLVMPDFIDASEDILRDEDGNILYNQRSLRGETAQGPRVSLAKSEQLPRGTLFKFEIRVLENSPLTKEVLLKLLEYGQLHGLGQWRNSGRGRFEVLEFNEVPPKAGLK